MELTPLADLRALSVGSSTITDVGLKELARFKKLEFLGLGTSPVTDAGVEAFRKVLPECRVNR
jgi:hypothetical protein